MDLNQINPYQLQHICELLNEQVYHTKPINLSQLVHLVQRAETPKEIILQLIYLADQNAPIGRIENIVSAFDW